MGRMRNAEALTARCLGLPVEQFDACFGLVLVTTLTSSKDHEEGLDLLSSLLYSRFLWLWAWECSRTAASTEFQHGRNRRRADRSMNWTTFAAVCLCQEAKRRLVSQHKAMKLASAQDTCDTTAENKGHKKTPHKPTKSLVRDFVQQDLIDSAKERISFLLAREPLPSP